MYRHLPSDCDSFRVNVWLTVMMLHNLRNRKMRVNQMCNVWKNDSNANGQEGDQEVENQEEENQEEV